VGGLAFLRSISEPEDLDLDRMETAVDIQLNSRPGFNSRAIAFDLLVAPVYGVTDSSGTRW
jgi:hypothetical protein